MIYNSIKHNAAGSIIDLLTYAKTLELPVKDCPQTRGFNQNDSAFWNCNLCGNDKEYRQPLHGGDRLFFQLNAPLGGWKGLDGSTYRIGAVLVANNTGDEFKLEDFSTGFYGAWSGTTNEGFHNVQTFFIDASYILSLFKNNDIDDCAFFIRFDLYSATVKYSELFTEQYFFQGCFDLLVQEESYTPKKCEMIIPKDASHLTNITTILINIATDSGTIVEERTINFLYYGMIATVQFLPTLLNVVFPEFGAWYYRESGSDTIVGLHGGYTITLFKINGFDFTSAITCGTQTIDTEPALSRYCYAIVPPHFYTPALNETIEIEFADGSTFSHTFNNNTWQEAIAYLNTNLPSIKWWFTLGNIAMPFQVRLNFTIFDSTKVVSKIGFRITNDQPLSNPACQTWLPIPTQDTACYDVCNDSVLLEGVYDVYDCDNHYFKYPTDAHGSTAQAFRLIQRINCKVTLSGATTAKVENDNSKVTSIKKYNNYILSGSPVPPYIAIRLIAIFSARHILIDGKEYLLDQNEITKKIDYSRMWALSIKLKDANCLLNYGCD